MITTIIFDLSNVYLEGILGSHRYFEKKLGTPVYDEYFYNEDFNKFMLGQLTEDEYLLIKKLHLKAQECLFIDDYKNNILAAESLGMKAIQFISSADLKRRLREVFSDVKITDKLTSENH